MGARVLHRGRVATTDLTAREAQPQVHPWGSEPEALLTAFERVWLYRPHERKMRIGSDRSWEGRHGSCPPSLSVSQDRSAGAGAAPTCLSTTSPRSSRIKVGIACTSNRLLTCSDSSALTFTSFSRPASSPANCSSTGLTIRQGPHQGAHMSTSTGIVA